MSLDDYSRSLLRSVATACQTAMRGVQSGVSGGTMAGLEAGLEAADGALGRANTQLARLRKRLPGHARAVRLAQKAYDKALEAHSLAEPTERGWPDVQASNRAAEAAMRAAQLILVDLDGQEGWAPEKRRAS